MFPHRDAVLLYHVRPDSKTHAKKRNNLQNQPAAPKNKIRHTYTRGSTLQTTPVSPLGFSPPPSLALICTSAHARWTDHDKTKVHLDSCISASLSLSLARRRGTPRQHQKQHERNTTNPNCRTKKATRATRPHNLTGAAIAPNTHRYAPLRTYTATLW